MHDATGGEHWGVGEQQTEIIKALLCELNWSSRKSRQISAQQALKHFFCMSSIADRLESLREENTQLQQRIDQAEEGLNNTKTDAQAIMLRTHVEQYRTKLNKNGS